MAYTVLARKYRSQTFGEIIGQDPIAQTLKNAIRTEKVAHAYLFAGPRGVGKTTMARVLAKSLNCLSFDEPTVEPCCKCDSCITVNLGEDIDVIEIDGATNNGVEQVRQLRENAIYRPARARFKIYIIDEVHMLSVPAFNALLKILEEPPEHVKFIFATTEPNKVIATIQSRCQRFDFRNISVKLITGQLASILKQEKIQYNDDLILPLAKMATGSMRDALSLLDRLISTGEEPLTYKLLEQFLGCPSSEQIYNLTASIGDSDAEATLAAAADLISSGQGEVQLVDSLIDYMRDLMVVKSAGQETKLLSLTEQQRKSSGKLAKKFDIAGLIYNITALEKLRWSIKNSETPRALLEACLLRLALSEHFLNIDELLSASQENSAGKIKKNKIADRAKTSAPETVQAERSIDTQTDSLKLSDLNSVKGNWQNVLRIIAAKLGNGTAGVLGQAVPTRFENSCLTLTFPASAVVSQKMCESNNRGKQIESLLSEQFSKSVKVRFETASEEESVRSADKNEVETNSQRKNALINEPAVKTVLLGLDATITAIEED